MKVRFRVISELTGNDLTDKECWLLTSEGRLVYKRGGSLYEDESLKVVFDIDAEEKTGSGYFLNTQEKNTISVQSAVLNIRFRQRGILMMLKNT